ncbi:hypothetical protein BX616_007126, partial [Lobosporangium transversale]
MPIETSGFPLRRTLAATALFTFCKSMVEDTGIQQPYKGHIMAEKSKYNTTEKSERNEYTQEKATQLTEDSLEISNLTDQDEFVYEPHQFTWRAAIVGSLLGCVVAASNLYLGLKIGWTFGAALWGSIFGFLVLKSLSRFTGSVFGPKENTVCQTAATASGGLSSGFVTAIPAMYRMGLMKDRTPSDDVVSLLLWTMTAAFFGTFFAVPLRSHFVINQDL